MTTLTMGHVAAPARADRLPPMPRREAASESSVALVYEQSSADMSAYRPGITAPGKPPPAYEVQFISALMWGLLGVVILRILLV